MTPWLGGDQGGRIHGRTICTSTDQLIQYRPTETNEVLVLHPSSVFSTQFVSATEDFNKAKDFSLQVGRQPVVSLLEARGWTDLPAGATAR